jgi:hypothetical protein
MKISGGLLYTETEEREAMDFLKSQGLNEDQITGVHTYLRSKVGSAVNLWSTITGFCGVAIGVFLMTVFGSGCVLF